MIDVGSCSGFDSLIMTFAALQVCEVDRPPIPA